jgi:hypothetical protein
MYLLAKLHWQCMSKLVCRDQAHAAAAGFLPTAFAAGDMPQLSTAAEELLHACVGVHLSL